MPRKVKTYLTVEMILDIKKKNPTFTATDILEFIKKDKTKEYITRLGTAVNRGSINQILSKNLNLTADMLARIPEGYKPAMEVFEKLPFSRKTYNRVKDAGGSISTRKIDELLKPFKLFEGAGTRYFLKDPTAKDVLAIENTYDRTNRLKPTTVSLMKDLHKKYYNTFYKYGKVPPIEKVVDVFDVTPSSAGNATVRLAQLYGGQVFKNDPLNNIRVDKSASKKLFKLIEGQRFGSPYNSSLYRAALQTIDEKLGNKANTFSNFKTQARNILKKNHLPIYNFAAKSPFGFNVNEIAGITARARSKAPEFSMFIDVMEGKLNQGTLANYQSVLGRATDAIEKNPSLLKEKMTSVNELAREIERNHGVKLPRLRAPDATKYYTDTRLEQLKNQGLDLKGASTRAGYTMQMPKGAQTIQEFIKDPSVQIGKAKTTLSNMYKTATPGEKKIIQIALGCRPGSASGGRIGFATGTLDACVNTKLTNQTLESGQKIVAGVEEGATGVLGKIRNTAKGFLGALGRFGPAAGKFGAIAAAGALAQPLIKQFMNDDPSTYLTDPDQQAGMLEALIEGERPKPRSEILDWGMGAGQLGATAAAIPGSGALYKYRRGLSEAKIPKAGPITESGLTAGDYLSRHAGKDYGKLRAGAGVGMKLLSGMFTPAGLLATEPLRIAQKRREGESWGDIATSPMTWMGPAFAPSMTKIATAGMKKGSLLPRLLRLGISRGALAAMGPVGWAGLAASLGWEGRKQYQDYKKGRGFFASDED